MRILFLTHYYPPEVNAPANRVHEHARVWTEAGHEVTVVTGVPNHPVGELFPGYRNAAQEETIDGVRVVRTWMYLTANAGFARRIANYVLFMCTAIWRSLWLPRPDVVVATSPQFFCGIAGAVVGLIKRRPFVLEVRDLWPDSIVQLGQLENPVIIRILEGIETLLYRSAAHVVVLTHAFARHVEGRGVPPERITFVPNGIDAERFEPRPPSAALLERHGLTGRFTVAYVGTLGLAHGLTTLLDAAVALKERMADLHVLLIGEGADRGRLEAAARERGLENVTFTGLLARDEIPEWLASIDVLLVMLRDLPVFETVIPSKIFEYLALERPVVLTAPRRSEIREMVEGADAGLCVDAENAQALADALLEVRSDPVAAGRRARAGRGWVLRDYHRRDLATRMADCLARVVEDAA